MKPSLGGRPLFPGEKQRRSRGEAKKDGSSYQETLVRVNKK
jgi:hypothetical protein